MVKMGFTGFNYAETSKMPSHACLIVQCEVIESTSAYSPQVKIENNKTLLGHQSRTMAGFAPYLLTVYTIAGCHPNGAGRAEIEKALKGLLSPLRMSVVVLIYH